MTASRKRLDRASSVIERIERADLYSWRDPAELARELRCDDAVSGERFIREREFRKHHEAWCLTRFAIGYGQFKGMGTMVRMILEQDEPPDGIVRASQGELEFDVTMVVPPERRMKDEYEPSKLGGLMRGGATFCHETVPSEKEALDWIAERLRQKRSRAYQGLCLLLYLNIWQSQVAQSTLRDAVQGLLTPWKQVWVFCSTGWDEKYAITNLSTGGPDGWFGFSLG